MKLLSEVALPEKVREGWGISRRDYPPGQDGKPGKEELYVSDGSDTVHVLDESLKIVRSIKVC